MTDSARGRLKSWQASSSDASLLKCRLWFEVSLVLVPIIPGMTQRRLEQELRNWESCKSPLFLLFGSSRTVPITSDPNMSFMASCFFRCMRLRCSIQVNPAIWFEDELCTLHCFQHSPCLLFYLLLHLDLVALYALFTTGE